MNWVGPLHLRHRGVLGMNARNVRFIGRYNDRARYPLVDHKLKTKLILTKAGVSVPPLLHTINTQREIEHVGETLLGLTSFVIKPAQGSGGKGILVIVGRRGEAFLKSNGDELMLLDLKRHLSNVLSGLYSLGGRTDIAFVETLIRLIPAFRDVSYEGVPDVRLIVFRGYPVMGMLRLATKASDGKANLHQGAVGVGLDLGTGRAISAVQYNRPIKQHPDTSEALDNIEVPNWRRMLVMAARCYEVTGLGYLGADLVLDKSLGPVLLELNARPGLTIQIANDEGLIPRLQHIEGLETVQPDVEDRVDYSMSRFSPQLTQPSLWEEEPVGP